ncbi:hypothetical protein L3049_16715 [Labilibaculum sp. DW002]|uniref:Uncharacterized protein n=1 Tax=Paralabilibaculum antarcticum TaxID=2912572 RepID=A0ABT5VW41_9BACT|nr:hypothetical protein [Labilibaculum sp. DW002]MDE5419636.1 hypothetical protein [Labilibaculum sp. DW002]
MDISIFTDKTVEPTQKDLQKELGSLYPLWEQIAESVREKYPNPKEEELSFTFCHVKISLKWHSSSGKKQAIKLWQAISRK